MNANPASISDEAVFAATGKPWGDWFAILDREGAARMKHPQIVRLLRGSHCVSHWWAQSITVEYERKRGLRDVHQTARGYEVSVSKTIAAPVEALFALWEDDGLRLQWLGAAMKLRKATADKSIRMETGDVGSDLSVYFYPKGESKCRIVIQQTKLSNRADVESRRAFWKAALTNLAAAALQCHPNDPHLNPLPGWERR